MSRYPQNDEDVFYDPVHQRSFVRKGSTAHEAVDALRPPGEDFSAAMRRFVELALEEKRNNPGGWEAAVHHILTAAVVEKRRAA